MYVTVAERVDYRLDGLMAGRGWRVREGRVPVGLRHAVPRISSSPLVALCGADITGWVMLAEVEFMPRHAASCQRCGQLVAGAGPGAPRGA